MTEVSTPACSRRIAAVWRRVCGVTFFPRSAGQMSAAALACLASRRATASRVSGVPWLVGNSGSGAAHRALRSHVRRTAGGWFRQRGDPVLAAFAVTGDVWGGAEVKCRRIGRPVSSETRRPVSIASASIAWSRRPIHVPWSGALSSASTSVSVRWVMLRAVVALGWHVEHAGDQVGVLGVAQAGEPVERADRGPGSIASRARGDPGGGQGRRRDTRRRQGTESIPQALARPTHPTQRERRWPQRRHDAGHDQPAREVTQPARGVFTRQRGQARGGRQRA